MKLYRAWVSYDVLVCAKDEEDARRIANESAWRELPCVIDPCDGVEELSASKLRESPLDWETVRKEVPYGHPEYVKGSTIGRLLEDMSNDR